jgi:hypothetical protein
LAHQPSTLTTTHALSETLPLFSPDFNRAVKIERRPEQISSDAGALVLREIDHRFGLSRRLAAMLPDDRLSEQGVHRQPEPGRTMLLLAAQGWRDQDDATPLRDDPVFRVAVSARCGTRPLERRRGEPSGLASQPTLSRMLETLSSSANRSALRDALLDLTVARLRAAGRLLGLLEEHGIPYVARIRSNSARDRELGELHLLPRLPSPDGSEPASERLVEARYAAKSWGKDRRVACVVVQEPGELFNRHFYLVASCAPEQLAAADQLAAYRKRGTAGGRFGGWMSPVPPTLSSTTRRKKTYRGRRPATTTHPRDPYACDDVQLLVAAVAYSLIQVVRCLLNAAGNERWGRRRVSPRARLAPSYSRRGGGEGGVSP